MEVVWVGNSGPMGKSVGQELGRWGLHHPWEGFLETMCSGEVLYRGCRVSGGIWEGPVSLLGQLLGGNCSRFSSRQVCRMRTPKGAWARARSDPILSRGQQARGRPGRRTTQAFQVAAAAATMDSSTPTGDAPAAATGCVWPVVAWRVLGGPGRKQVGKVPGPGVGGQGLGPRTACS